MHLSPEVMRALRSVSISYFIESESKSGDIESGSLKENSGAGQVNESFIDWTKVCEWLASNIKADDQLTLQLNCDAITKNAAAAFLEPLHKLPRPKDLSICLGSRWNPDIQQIIMATVCQKTRFQLYHPPSPTPFRFFDLPVELQLHILDLAGLITFEDRLLYVHDLKRFVSMFCLQTLQASNANDVAHYCPATRTSFSTVTPCWRAPHILFLVNNTMRQLIIPMFYSRSIFEVLYRPDLSPSCAEWSVQNSTFLRGFPPYAFRFLRHIFWDFVSEDNLATIHPTDQAIQDWLKSLEYVSQAVPAGALTMELYLVANVGVTANNEDIGLESIDWVVRPMTCLRGLLKDHFIHITLGEKYESEVQAAKEQSLEKNVMGDDYDSLARGKWSSSRTEDLEDSEG